jgi:ribosome biogenesis protein Tsr3
VEVNKRPVEISHNPELLQLAEEVKATNKPRLLKHDNTALAILTPVKKKQLSKAKSKAIRDTLALAGAWSDLSWEETEKELDRIRHQCKPILPLKLDL